MATTYIVSIFFEDQTWGGAEEGGWWYDAGELVRIIKTFKSEEGASAYCRRANHWLDRFVNRHRRPYTSVLSEGRYVAAVDENIAPARYPESKPHYE
jgi:hypothetical protein